MEQATWRVHFILNTFYVGHTDTQEGHVRDTHGEMKNIIFLNFNSFSVKIYTTSKVLEPKV